MRSSLIHLIIFLTGSLIAFPQTHFHNDDFIIDVLTAIDSLAVTEELNHPDYVTVYFGPKSEGKEDILKIVRTFYASEEEFQNKTTEVLDFLTYAYSEHDFLESGNWVEEKKHPNRNYIPYSGELPEYTINDFKEPLTGIITSGYGYRENLHRNHYGIDVSAHIGDTVRCALPGIVTKIGYERGGYGNYVVVAHSGDVETIYAHLQMPCALVGQTISAGEIIGVAGSTGNSTGPHLHFETRYRGLPVNPLNWFKIYGSKSLVRRE